jgi:hypothetical protein
MGNIGILTFAAAVMFGTLGFITLLMFMESTGSRAGRSVTGSTARFMSNSESKKVYKEIPFTPDEWRRGKNLPVCMRYEFSYDRHQSQMVCGRGAQHG